MLAVLQCCRANRQWRAKDFHVEITVRRGRSCHADACDAAAYFGRATEFGAAKSVRFENKKAVLLDLEFVLEKG